jgi:hypothetical protein
MTPRRALGVLVATVVGAATLVLSASPASAHGVGGVQPRNYETVLVRMAPHVDGVTFRVVDLGDDLEVTNTTRHDLTVLGYDGEPYLRVGQRGVFENIRSPATYLNKALTLTPKPPKIADASAIPMWRQVSDGDTARWHDHRAHFMGGESPPEVQRDPSSRHVVGLWTVTMRTDGVTTRASGRLVYVPPPSPWPYVLLALALAGLVFALSRTRVWRATFAVALSLLTASALGHVVGLWDATTASLGAKLAESAYSLVGVVLGLLALAWLWRRGADSAMPLVLIASIFLFFAGGLGDVATLGHSQIPTTYSPVVARVLIAIDLGLGLGLGVAAAVRLRRTTRSDRAAPPRTRVATPVTS